MTKTQAWQEAEKLFVRFSTRLPHAKESSIEVTYPERFRKKRFIIGAVIPIKKLRLGFVTQLMQGNESQLYEPAIMNSAVGPCLRFIWAYPDIDPKDRHSIHELVRRKRDQLELEVGMKAYISPTKGLIETLRKLRAFVH